MYLSLVYTISMKSFWILWLYKYDLKIHVLFFLRPSLWKWDVFICICNFLGCISAVLPYILEHPKSQEIMKGATLVLNCQALGKPPFVYHWYRNNQFFSTTDESYIKVCQFFPLYSNQRCDWWYLNGAYTEWLESKFSYLWNELLFF